MKEDYIRSFISIAIDTKVQEKIKVLQQQLIKKITSPGTKISWVKAETIHLTLKFLGDIPTKKTEPILRSLHQAAEGVEAFSFKVTGLGVFPNLKAPRVIWIGISDGLESLKILQGRIEQELNRLGFPKEKKKFSPHLTLGRIRSLSNASSLTDLLRKIASPEAGISAVHGIRLMKSDLRPLGAIHTEIGWISLGGTKRE